MATETEPALLKSDDEFAGLKTQFLASLNHEVRTPLTGILGMTDLLQETALDEEQKEYVATVRVCADDLLALFNKTLEFSDLSSGRVVLERQELHLRESLRGVISTHLSSARAKGLTLRYHLASDLPEVVVGDAGRLQQVLFHLLDNAVKFTERGKVEVSASGKVVDGKLALRLVVRDTGIGIPPDKLLAVFESFRQLDSGLARSYPGLGLGLSLVQKLTALMGGNLSVESDMGHGTVFSLTLPLEVPPGAVTKPGSATTLSSESHARRDRRVLLVEDNDAAQKIVTHILNRAGYEVTCTANGPEAVKAASRDPYDLVLMDLQMPEMDGFEASARIRDLEGCHSTPIIAITANVTEDHRRLCFASGMQGFVAKPVQAEQLLEALSAVLAEA